jgi:hypothetical protein
MEPKFHHYVHKSPPDVPLQSHTNSVDDFPAYFFKHYFNIILPSTQSVPNSLFPSTFPTTTPYAFLLHHACRMLCPATLHNLINLILYCGEYKSLSLSLCNVTPACYSPSL